MAYHKNIHGRRDWSKIDVNDPHEVEYVHHQFPWLSHEEIEEAIKVQGADRDAVRTFLEEKSDSGKRRDEEN
jgi:hypothetical protein